MRERGLPDIRADEYGLLIVLRKRIECCGLLAGMDENTRDHIGHIPICVN